MSQVFSVSPAGGGGAGHQCPVPEIPSEAQRDDDLPLQHAQG